MTSDPDSVVDSISSARCCVLPWRRLAEKGSPHSRKIFSKCIENTQYNLLPRLVGIKSYDCRNWNISQYFNKNIINLREAANQRAASNHVTPMWQSNVSDFPQRVFKATSLRNLLKFLIERSFINWQMHMRSIYWRTCRKLRRKVTSSDRDLIKFVKEMIGRQIRKR